MVENRFLIDALVTACEAHAVEWNSDAVVLEHPAAVQLLPGFESGAVSVQDCAAQLAHLSQVMTLEPGDVFFTGTPGGVGAAMKPPQFLKAGDRVRIEIDRIGFLENEVVDEVAPAS